MIPRRLCPLLVAAFAARCASLSAQEPTDQLWSVFTVSVRAPPILASNAASPSSRRTWTACRRRGAGDELLCHLACLTPSRGSILTGLYPQRNGLYDMVRNDMVNYVHLYTPDEYAVSPEMTLGLDPKEAP